MSESASAVLLRDFVNTYNVEDDLDELGAPSDLGAWLTERALTPPGTHADESDLIIAVALREGLRAALLTHQGSPPDLPAVGFATGLDGPVPGLDEALAALPLRVSLDGPALLPTDDGARAGLARIAAAVMGSVADGSWPRLKACPERTCQWAFIDTSKNRSRTWCSMRVCGNRTKTRAYRARHRDATA